LNYIINNEKIIAKGFAFSPFATSAIIAKESADHFNYSAIPHRTLSASSRTASERTIEDQTREHLS
jgi:hypothetical protein